MSDQSVRAALRSDAHLVVVEAPAGCGKTYQGADYAREVAGEMRSGWPLIITHTHAACSVFAERTKPAHARVEIRTVDSIVGSIASAYHLGLGLPADTATWIRQREDGYSQVAAMVSRLLKRHPLVASSLARRHPIIICDEHQDSSDDQHAVAMALAAQGAKIRIFADPMQEVFGSSWMITGALFSHWNELTQHADAFETLDFPHRWAEGCPALGSWTLSVREALKKGGTVDLRGRPSSVAVVYADNQAPRDLDYQLDKSDRAAVDRFERDSSSLLVLTRHNRTARSLRALFNRRIPLWEGHVRGGLGRLVDAINAAAGDREALAAGVVEFLGSIGKGFSPSAFGNVFAQEVQQGCTRPRRGKAAAVQELARCLVADPNHYGAGKTLRRIAEMLDTDPVFASCKVDCHREFWDAVHVCEFETPDIGLAEVTHRRNHSRPKPPARSISTIHKAKGLECDSVIVLPCDERTFPDSHEARCVLYVALSRAKKRLMVVVSKTKPSPLLNL